METQLPAPALSSRLGLAPFRLLATAAVVFLLSGLLAALDVIMPWRVARAIVFQVTFKHWRALFPDPLQPCSTVDDLFPSP
jgi:hypothetical protein